MLKRDPILSRHSVVTACSVIALLTVAACAGYTVETPFEQPPYLWPATAPAVSAKGAHPATATTVFTVRTSEWLNTPEEAKALIAAECGPAFKTARVFRHEGDGYQGNGSPLHPIELVVYCGDLKPRVAVYPEPGAEPLSSSLSQLNTPPTAVDVGELMVLR